MSNQFYFLRGIVGDVVLLREQQSAINKIVRGTYGSGDLEKLRGHDIYSLRLNQEARLLFMIISLKGKPCLLVLDYIPTHDYHKSRFLKSGVLKRFLERQEGVHSNTIQDPYAFDPTECTPLVPNTLDAEASPEWRVLDYFNDQFIELSLPQQAALKLQLPALISGEAGAGKSCIAMVLLSYFLQQQSDLTRDEQDPIRLLYVTQSSELVGLVRSTYIGLPKNEDMAMGVEFKTYNELALESIDTTDMQLIDKEDFIQEWYQTYLGYLKHAIPEVFDLLSTIGAERLYQEFRVCSGYSMDAYHALGQHQSKYTEAQRDDIYKTFERYVESLKRSHRFNPDLMIITPSGQYDLVLIDEAQDLSLRQLIELSKFAKKGQMVAFMDSHQGLYSCTSVRPFILQQFNIPAERHIQLDTTYRCPVRIMQVANEVIALKQILSGGLVDKYESSKVRYSEAERGLGAVYIINPDQLEQQTWLMEQAKRSNFAIVTRASLREVAMALFNSPLVFTPEEIKGLEYDGVICYRLFDESFFKDVMKQWRSLDNPNQPQHRAKKGTFNESFLMQLNMIYTAFTRPKQALFIIEPLKHYFNILLNRLTPLANSEAPTSDCIQTTLYSYRNWQAETLAQFDRRNYRVAQAIFDMKIKRDGFCFEEFLTTHGRMTARSSLSVDHDAVSKTIANDGVSNHPVKFIEAKRPAESNAITTVGELTSLPSLISPLEDVHRQMIEGLINNFNVRRLIVVLEVIPHELHAHFWSYLLDRPRLKPWDGLEREITGNKFLAPMIDNLSLLQRFPTKIMLECFKERKNKFMVELLNMFINIQSIITEYGNHVSFIQKKNQPLHLLALLADHQTLTRLYNLGANLDITNVDGETPIFELARWGNISRLEWFKQFRANFNVNTLVGSSLVHIAVSCKKPGVLELLHRYRIDLNIENIQGVRPFQIALMCGDFDMLCTLSRLGVNFNQPFSDGFTAAHYAVLSSSVNQLKLLKRLGADLNIKSKEGVTPFLLAARQNDVGMLRLLHTLSATKDAKCNNGNTALHYAVSGGGKVEVLMELNRIGVRDVNAVNVDGYTACLYAASCRNFYAVGVLIKMGSDIHVSTKTGNTLGHFVAKYWEMPGARTTLMILKNNGFDVTRTDNDGNTPYQVAQEEGANNEFMLLFKSPVNQPDESGHSSALSP